MLGFIRSLIARLRRTNSQADIPDSGEIAQARWELTSEDDVVEAVIKEPRLQDYSGRYTTDLKAVIPVATRKYPDPAPLTFDVDSDQLAEFLDAHGLDVDEIGHLSGSTIPVKWVDGSPVVAWDELHDGDEDVEVGL